MIYKGTFFFTDKNKNKVLVVVPHEDDELNLMGGFLVKLIEVGACVNVVYITNGDYNCRGDIRIHEAIASLENLGICNDNIFFLGYPDGSKLLGQSLFDAKEPVITANGGFTYGAEDKHEYCFLKNNIHNECTTKNLLKDLTGLILDLKPDVIFATDNDDHHDHQLASFIFDFSIKNIDDIDKDYKPLVFKGFAYSTAFEARKDLFRLNLLSTVEPEWMYNFKYPWQDRVRFPVSDKCVELDMEKNLIFKSLCKHVSQAIIKKALCVINGDIVFWYIKGPKNLIGIRKLTADSNFVYGTYNYLLKRRKPCIGYYRFGNVTDLKIVADGSKYSLVDQDDNIVESMEIRKLCVYDLGKLLKKIWINRNRILKLDKSNKDYNKSKWFFSGSNHDFILKKTSLTGVQK